jgi:PAS domain S-box-containing protein
MSKITKNRIIEIDTICRAVFGNSMDAILITAPDGRILAANPSACEMFGMTEKEIIAVGRNGLVDTTDENLPYLLAERESIGKAIGELRQIRKDGSIFPTEVSSGIFKSPDGDEFTIMIIRDITNKKQSLNELNRAKDFAENLIETANVIFVQLDNTGVIIKINNTFEKISGYKREEILGKNWFEILVPSKLFPEVWEEFINVTRDQKIARTFKNPILTKNGEERHILWSNSPLFDDRRAIGTISYGIDITDINRKNEEIQRIEYLLRTILYSAPITIYATDKEGLFTLSDGKKLRNVGLKPGENIGVSAYDLYGSLPFVDFSDNVLTGEEVLSRALSGEVITAVNQLGDVYFENHIGPIIDNDGEITGAVGVAIDISDRKIAEDKLSESEKQYRTLFNSIDEGFCIIEVIFDENEKPVDYRFLEVNPSFERQTDLIDAKGKRMRELAPKHEEHWFEMYGRIALTGKPERFVNKAEQLHRWYDVYAFRIGNPEDRHVAILFNDITERKQISDALRLSQENLDLALKSAEMGVWHYDISKKERIFNGHTCRLLDIEPTIFKGTENEFYKIVHPKDRVKIKIALKKSISTKVPYSVEYRVMRKDGTVSYISARGKLISGPDGKAKEILGIVWDSTERKLFEEKLRKSEAELRKTTKELRALSKHLEEEIEKEKTQIARDLHDDLGQKLTALNLNISWIKSRMGVQSRSVVNKLDSMINLLDETVKSVHEISYKLRPSIPDDLELQAALEWQLSDFSKSTGISYTLSFSPAKSVENREISLTIFRIIQESLTNVVRHSNATKVTIDVYVDESELKLVIKDNGIGIGKNKIASYKSFGLIGMRERAKAYDGEFQIKGKKGEGTVIIVKIPLNN